MLLLDAAARVERVLVHDRQQAFDDHRAEPERELVEEKQARPAGEAARHREHLLLAARQGPTRRVRSSASLGKYSYAAFGARRGSRAGSAR